MIKNSLSWDQFVLLDGDLENNNYQVPYESIVNTSNVNFEIYNSYESYESYSYWGDIIAKTAFTGWLIYILFVV